MQKDLVTVWFDVSLRCMWAKQNWCLHLQEHKYLLLHAGVCTLANACFADWHGRVKVERAHKRVHFRISPILSNHSFVCSCKTNDTGPKLSRCMQFKNHQALITSTAKYCLAANFSLLLGKCAACVTGVRCMTYALMLRWPLSLRLQPDLNCTLWWWCPRCSSAGCWIVSETHKALTKPALLAPPATPIGPMMVLYWTMSIAYNGCDKKCSIVAQH